MAMEDRIRNLEERLSHQQVLLEDLDSALQSFLRRIDDVEGKVEQLASQAAAGTENFGPQNDPPPHF